MFNFKKIFFVFFSIPCLTFAQQRLQIEECYQKAQDNYPLIKRTALLQKTLDYNVSNASKGWLPQFSINAQASYQSDVTQLPFSIPGYEVDPLSKDQYKATVELNQTIYDGGAIAAQKQLAKKQSAVEIQKNEVDLDKLKERINQIYFGILMAESQLKQSELTKTDLLNTLKKVESQLKNGVVFRSNVDQIKAQLVSIEQRQIEIKSMRKSYLDMLSAFLNQKLDDNTQLEKTQVLSLSADNNDKSLKLLDLQSEALQAQIGMINAKNRPKLGVFAQGGYGKPGFNMLKNEFDTFYIAGAKLSIPLSGFYTRKNEISTVAIQRTDLSVQRETYLFNSNLQTTQNNNELLKYQALLAKDDELVNLRQNITQSTYAQLQNGVANSADYIRETNAAEQARLQKDLHEIQFLLTQYNQKVHLGN